MVSNRVGWRENLHEIIFEADTPAGKLFDVGLLLTIVVSVTAVCLESVPWIDARYHRELLVVEWAITIAFTIEYALRLIAVQRPLAYARSFFGVVDLLAVLPTYLSLFLPGAHTLLVIRALRLLRIFRIFKLARFLSEADILVHIPIGMYWAVVTVTTVGYGDVSPSTGPGRPVAAVLMLLGYGILAVPTGIFSAELIRASRTSVSTQACLACSAEGHDVDAVYCKFCGEHLGAQGHSQE